MNYGFVERNTTSDGTGIPGGVGGGMGYDGHVIFYVGVPDVEAALQKAESLGGTRRMGPQQAPTDLVVGHFTDPEGNVSVRHQAERPLRRPPIRSLMDTVGNAAVFWLAPDFRAAGRR
jgi:predicted enzyme related to lactoylglutathione lyase